MTAYEKVNNYFENEENSKSGFYEDFLNESLSNHPIAFGELTLDKGVKMFTDKEWHKDKGEYYVIWICDLNNHGETLFEDNILCDSSKELCWVGQKLLARHIAWLYDNSKK